MLEWFSVPPGCWSLCLMQYGTGGFDQCSACAELTWQHSAALILLLPGKQLTAIPAWPGSALKTRNALKHCPDWWSTMSWVMLRSPELHQCVVGSLKGALLWGGWDWILELNPTISTVFSILMRPFLISKCHSKSCICLRISLFIFLSLFIALLLNYVQKIRDKLFEWHFPWAI